VASILAGYAYHLNVMPLDAQMPDAGSLVQATDIALPPPGAAQVPVVVLDERGVRVTAVRVRHGRAVRRWATGSTPRTARLCFPVTPPWTRT
jgi:hypothetical protein